MRIKIDAIELKEILDKHFGGIDIQYDLEFIEGNYAVETRISKEKLLRMVEAPTYKKVAMQGIFENMGVLLSVVDLTNQ